MAVKKVTNLNPEAVLRTAHDNMHPALRSKLALDFVELYRSVRESAPEGSLDPVGTVQDWAKLFLAADYHADAQNSLYVLYVRHTAVAGCIVQQGVLKGLVSTLKGAGAYVMQEAVDSYANPAAMLTCVEGLEGFYAKHGWQVLSREANWTEGESDILTMYQPELCYEVHGHLTPIRVGMLYPSAISDGCPLDVLPLHVLDPELTTGNRTVECWYMSHSHGVNIVSTDGFRLYDGSHLKPEAQQYICDSPLPARIAQQIPMPVLLAERPRLSNDGQNMLYTRRTKDDNESTVTQKVGRYLRRRCSELDDEEIKQLCAAAKSSMQAFQLKFTRDPVIIQDVYENGPSSCMARKYSLYVDGHRMHPNEIFVHPDNDLTLAYLEAWDGEYVARTWVSRDRDLYSDTYGKDDKYTGVSRRMERMLEDEDYEHDPEGLMYGQPLLRIVADCGNVVLGYVDGSGYGVEDDGDTLWVGEGRIEGSYSQGISQGEQRSCDNCYDAFPVEDEVYTQDGYVCSRCADNYVLALVHGTSDTSLVHSDNVMVIHGHPEVNYVEGVAWHDGDLDGVYEITVGYSAGDLVEGDSALFHNDEVWLRGEAPQEVLDEHQ